MLTALGEPESALAHYAKAEQAYLSGNFRVGLSEVLNNVANIHRDRGEYAEALTTYRRATALQRAEGRHNGLAYSLTNYFLSCSVCNRYRKINRFPVHEQAEALSGIFRGFALALFVMYALLAIPFGSYVKPLVIMASVPFGFVGAVLGHLFMGLDLGMLSMFGLVGLAGVVVNDSLVLMDFVGAEQEAGHPIDEAIRRAAKSRFRPILLTSLTTFLGVFPLIIERSVQAQFLVPMAASLGFGILFATVVIMLLVPALTKLEWDATQWVREFRSRRELARAQAH